MTIVVLQLPNVKRKSEIRPQKCLYCQGETFQRWGKVSKLVRDYRHRTVTIYRYRCFHCRRTFRHYPEGVDQADQTQRLRKLAVIYWVLGMSLRSTVLALTPFGVQLSHLSVWRDMQEQADLLKKRRQWQKVRVLGVDGAYPRLKGKKPATLIAVDLGTGQPIAIGRVDEANPQAVRRFLAPLVQRLAGISSDGSRWKIQHLVLRSNGKQVAQLMVEGTWLDLSSFKSAIPPQELVRLSQSMERTAIFEPLRSLVRIKPQVREVSLTASTH
jgi:hypothetical protein